MPAAGWLVAAGRERQTAWAFLLQLAAQQLGKNWWCLSLSFSSPSLPQEAFS